ncbi:MAG: hypothetical protein ABDH28_00060 [Brevinematia bacterium]
MDDVVREAVEEAIATSIVKDDSGTKKEGLDKQTEIVNNNGDTAPQGEGEFPKENQSFQQETGFQKETPHEGIPAGVALDYGSIKRVAKEINIEEKDVEEIVKTLGITPNVILEARKLVKDIDELNRKVVVMDTEVKQKPREDSTKKATHTRTSWTNIAEQIKRDRKLI